MKRAAAGMNGFATIVSNGALESFMSMPFADIEAQALKLSPQERVLLAEHLLASVGTGSAVEQAWAEEVDRRLREVEAGEAVLTPLDEVIRRARQALS